MPHPLVRVGGIEVLPLCEGWAPLPLAAEAPGRRVDWEEERRAHPWVFAEGDAWAWHVHAFLLRTPAGIVLVDAGIGDLGRPPYAVPGRIEEELAAAGVDAEDVLHVVLTHLHADHAGGTTRPDGAPRFPNALHHVHPADWSFFALVDDPADVGAREAMTVLEEAGMLDLTPEDREILPGVRTLHAPGHTPGHRCVLVEDGPFRMLLAGDLLHLPYQVAHPAWGSNHDEDTEEGARSRARLVERAVRERWAMAVGHFARPFGGVVEGPAGRRWVSA